MVRAAPGEERWRKCSSTVVTLIELHVDSSVLVKRWKQNEIFKSEYGEWQYCFLHIVKLDSAITITITSGAGIWYSVSRNQLPRLNIDCFPGKEDDLVLLPSFEFYSFSEKLQ